MTHRADASNTLDNRGYTGPLIRGLNPVALIDTPLRDRITDSLYWKESCFGLNAATLLDRAVEMTYVGGTYGVAMKPTPFICLAFKLLTLTPDKDIVLEYLERGGDEWKYLRALAAFYVRLTFPAVEVYLVLEKYLEDRRKLRRRRKEGYTLTYMDEFVDELLTKDRVCGTSLWKLPSRQVLEDEGRLDERVSPLQAELDEEEEEEEAMAQEERDEDGHMDVHEVRNERGSESESEDGTSATHRSRSEEESD
jgi:pre-mRNA-splicing factor 38A